MSKKGLYAIIGAATAVILGLVWGLVFLASTGNADVAPSPGATSSPTQIDRTLSGKTIDEDRQDVFDATVDLLNATNAPVEQAAFLKLLEELDSASVSDIPQEFIAKIRFVDKMSEDLLKITTYQALVTFASLSKASSENGEVTSLYLDGPNGIFVDQEAGIAHVPMNIFVNQEGQPNTFSLEFTYIDGEWLMQPYSVLDQLRLSLALQQQMESLLSTGE